MNKEFKFLIYKAEQEDIKVNVVIKDETIWLTQKAMAELFGVDRTVITKHLKNIFDENELDVNAVIRKYRITAIDSKNYYTKTVFVNLI